jgi:hypothetical protein
MRIDQIIAEADVLDQFIDSPVGQLVFEYIDGREKALTRKLLKPEGQTAQDRSIERDETAGQLNFINGFKTWIELKRVLRAEALEAGD